VLAVTARAAQADALVSADSAFVYVDSLVHVTPDAWELRGWSRHDAARAGHG